MAWIDSLEEPFSTTRLQMGVLEIPEVEVKPPGRGMYLPCAGIIGLPVWTRLRTTLDLQNDRIILESSTQRVGISKA